MMTKQRIIIITSLFLLVLTGMRLSWMTYHAPPDQPYAVQGVLDLRDWDLTMNRPITLDGEWEFSPFHFITTGQDVSGFEPNYIQVPSAWNHSFPENTDYYYGTYRLRIMVTDTLEQAYGLRVSNISTSSKLYVNGHLLKESGHLAKQEKEYTAQNIPYTVSFTPVNGEIELVIQVANASYIPDGGINNSLKFGNLRAVNKHTNFAINMQVLVVIVFLLHGVYAFILYFFVPRQKGLIYFSMLVICAVISILVEDDKLLYVWLPLNYEWGLKLTFFSYLGITACLLKLATYLIETKQRFNIFALMFSLYGFFAILLLLVPLSLTVPLTWLLMALNFSSFMVFTLLTLQEVLRGNEDFIYLFLVSISNWANTFWGILKTMGVIQFTMYYPVDYIVAFLGLAAFWFKLFFRATSQAELLARKLQKADKHKDIFMINLSHELRNPLHGMINIAQTLLDNKQNSLNEQNRADLSLLITVGRRMSMMINELTDVTRLKEGNIRLQFRPIHLQSIAQGVLAMLRFMTEDKPIRLVLDIPASFPMVRADENRVIQILFNLLHNAIKNTEEGSITVSATVDNGQAQIHINDTGIGMDEETQQRIFHPYEQGAPDSAATNGGIGLGLSICKQLVELHGGTLEVSSMPAQGSVFTFTLPLVNEAEQEKQVTTNIFSAQGDSFTFYGEEAENMLAATSDPLPTTSSQQDLNQPAYPSNPPKILVVDDDPLNSNILANILLAEDYEVIIANSGKEALAKLDLADWDLVIADVMMPHMSGYHLSRLIRERFSMSELPILLLTARYRPEDITVGFLSGANDYVAKPVDSMELKARVQALTRLKYSVKEHLRLEAALLQAQIKPHFLFNTLNTISALSEIDIGKMNALLGELANYLRKSFDFDNVAQLVPLEDELELVRSYLFIEQARFEERLRVLWKIETKASYQLPPFSIQVLVENAIHHGILKRLQGGTIIISISEEQDSITVAVTDDGVGMDATKLKHFLDSPPDSTRGIGLYNTNRRLRQIYGQGIQIESIPNQGTTVSFQIPKKR